MAPSFQNTLNSIQGNSAVTGLASGLANSLSLPPAQGSPSLSQVSQSAQGHIAAAAMVGGLNAASGASHLSFVGPNNVLNGLQSLSSLRLPPVSATSGGITLAATEAGAVLGAAAGAVGNGLVEGAGAAAKAMVTGQDPVAAGLNGLAKGATQGLIDGAAEGAKAGYDIGRDVASAAKSGGLITV